MRRPIVSSSVLASLIVSAVLSVAWPIAIFLICRGRMTLAVRNMLVGAAVFLVFSERFYFDNCNDISWLEEGLVPRNRSS